MPATYTLTAEHQTPGLAWVRRLSQWGGYALMLLGVLVLLDMPMVRDSRGVAILLWLLWSGMFTLAASVALPEVYIRLNGLRRRDTAVEISPAGLRIDGMGLLAWGRFYWLSGERPDCIWIMRMHHSEPLFILSGRACPACLESLPRECPARRLPALNPDGSLLVSDDAAPGAGAILTQMHGGTDVLYTFSGDEGLAACAARGPRILLGQASQTFADRRKGAEANALVMVMLAFLPAIGLAALFGREAGWPVFLVILIGAAIRGAWKEMTTPGSVWTRREWIDLETRTWNARREFPDQSLPTQKAQVPLADLTLVCFTQYWEQGQSHEVGLCKLAELRAAKDSEPGYLNVLHSAETPEAAERFALALAKMWDIGCWRIKGGSPVQKQQLA